MTEATDFRPSREVPFSAQLTGELQVSTGLTKRLEIEELWADGEIDFGIADVVDALPGLMVESALSRLDQGAPAEFDIDRELKLAPEAEMPEDLIVAEEPSLGEVSAEDRRDEVDEARNEAALKQGLAGLDLLQDIADADADLVIAP